jgi:CheY-like chemotaxis protein
MKKVVVAEASPTIKSVADSLLRQNGYDVVCTSDGLQAWEVVLSEKPDLVLTGLGLSGISGLELCRQISSDRVAGGIPVVLMLGAKDPVKDEEIVNCGARGKLRKPFSPKDLLSLVNKLLGEISESQMPVATPEKTKFVTQISSTQHLHKKPENFNLEWLDLSDTTPVKHGAKMASFDLSVDDQNLIIDDDQYGLANPQPAEEEAPSQKPDDEDYEWFVGEIKKEIENKPGQNKMPKPHQLDTSHGEIKFDDIRPAEADDKNAVVTGVDSVSDSSAVTRLKIPSTIKTGQGVRNISDEEIALIADRIAMKLAIQIASRIDKNQIIDAVRTVLNS